jgi:hypothetical protein
MRKYTVVILNKLNIKNNKIDKDNFKKNHNKKNHVGNTVVIHSVLKKKTIKLNSQPVQYLKIQINKNNSKKEEDNFGQKTKKKKNMWRKLKLNSQPVQY